MRPCRKRQTRREAGAQSQGSLADSPAADVHRNDHGRRFRMPYIPAGRKRAVSFLTAAVAALLLPAAASAMSPPDWIAATLSSSSYAPPSCTDPNLTQVFQSFNDQNYYALAPGEAVSNFTGTGWMLL